MLKTYFLPINVLSLLRRSSREEICRISLPSLNIPYVRFLGWRRVVSVSKYMLWQTDSSDSLVQLVESAAGTKVLYEAQDNNQKKCPTMQIIS